MRHSPGADAPRLGEGREGDLLLVAASRHASFLAERLTVRLAGAFAGAFFAPGFEEPSEPSITFQAASPSVLRPSCRGFERFRTARSGR
jgi:hypothetical protein